jgi:Tat protein secretion system quality control protein TatD with DNase activity
MLPSYRLKRVLLHWFSYPITALIKAIDNGYYITEGPPVTYSNGITRSRRKNPTYKSVDRNRWSSNILETPYNGQLTKPSYIRNVVDAVAEIKKIRQVEEVAEQIAKNFERIL